MTATHRARLALAIVVAVLIVLPAAVAGRISLGVFVFIGLFSLIVIGLSLLAGHAGQVSLGQAAFYGLGAYLSAISTMRLGLAPWLALPLAAAGAALIAYLLGAPIFVLRGHFLVLGTLGLNIVIDVLVRNMQGLTGGPTGLTGIPPLSIGPVAIVGDLSYYYLVWTLVLAVLWLGRNLVSSSIGRVLTAVRASEVAAASVGINPAFYKTRVFAFSGALAGLAGALYVHYLSFVSPSPFAFNFSIDLLVMSVLGGIFHLPGAVVGTAIVTGLREGLRTVMPRLLGSGASAEYEIVVFGLLLAAVVIFLPAGVWPHLAVWLQLESGRAVQWAQVPSTALAVSVGSPAGVARDMLLRVDGLQKRFGGLLAVQNLSLDVRAGECVAIIGPNGAGKTTAFNLISGMLRPNRGAVYLRGLKISDLPAFRIAALGVARTFQTPKVFPDLTVLENVMIGLHRTSRTGFVGAMLGLGRREDAQAAASAGGYLEVVGLVDRADVRASALPFGALRLVEIGRALATRPVLLLLDEPASGLSGAERADLVRLLRLIRDAGVTVVLVEHDVALVMNVADRVLVLNYGQCIAEGPPSQIRNDPRVIAAYLGEEAS
jgi:branched-chain amino acid transport system permease protein